MPPAGQIWMGFKVPSLFREKVVRESEGILVEVEKVVELVEVEEGREGRWKNVLLRFEIMRKRLSGFFHR